MLLIQATCAALILAYTLPSPHAAALSRSPPAVTMRGGPPAHVTAKKKANKKKKVAKIKTAAQPSEDDLRAAHMALVQDSVARHAPSLLSQLDDNGYAIIDNFLPPATIQQMRAECEGLRTSGKMVASQSTRWDEEKGEAVTYEKRNVLSTNVAGGDDYHLSPRLVEYCVSLVSSLPPLVNAKFEAASSPQLSARLHTNKLAVCLGDGSQYAKHYDNHGGGDARKLTVLLYLQERDAWREENGGCFRMFVNPPPPQSGEEGETPSIGVREGRARALEPLQLADDYKEEEEAHACVDIAPLGGRLLAFWSDTMIHGVTESHASGEAEYRWALTVWLHTEDQAAITFDAEAEERHFGAGGTSHRALAG